MVMTQKLQYQTDFQDLRENSLLYSQDWIPGHCPLGGVLCPEGGFGFHVGFPFKFKMAKRDSTPNESFTFSTINDAYVRSRSTNHEKILQFNRIKGPNLNDQNIS